MKSLQELVAKSIDLIPHLKFDASHAWHRSMVCLYLAMVEYADVLVVMEKNEKAAGIASIVRSLLEAYVDLYNLSQDANYGYGLEFSYRKEWLRVAAEAERGTNRYLNGMSSAAGFLEQIKQWQADVAASEGKGHRALNKEQKFALAGMEEEYRSIYNFLCSESHNNIRALSRKHIEIVGDPPKVQVVVLSPPGEDEEKDLLIAVDYFQKANKLIHEFLKTGNEHKF
jgi:hypothetical protein